MADNITLPTSEIVATDQIGATHYPKTKIAFGVDETATDVSALDPFPVEDSGLSVAKDDRTGTSVMIKFGRNDNITIASAPEYCESTANDSDWRPRFPSTIGPINSRHLRRS